MLTNSIEAVWMSFSAAGLLAAQVGAALATQVDRPPPERMPIEVGIVVRVSTCLEFCPACWQLGKPGSPQR